MPSCAEGGVLGVLPGIIGTIQATEAIKLIIGAGQSLVGRLMLFDALDMGVRFLKLRRDPKCAICGDHPTVTKLIDYEQFCGIVPRSPRRAAAREVDGRRVLATRDAYPPPEMPSHLVVIGSGVTGVEFVHMFSSFGCDVTLVVSRQQVLPTKDPEVAAALEDEFLRRGRAAAQGRAGRRHRPHRRRRRGRALRRRTVASQARTPCSPSASVPNSDGLGLEDAGVEVDGAGYIPIQHHCVTNVRHIYAAGDVSGKLPLSSVAAMQGRKVAEHVMGLHTREHRHLDYDKAASAIFTEPEIADVGLAEADAFAAGRKVRTTKVPFSASAKALINNDPRGFVKLISDPATGVVLGGSIVGRHAAELISVIAVAVTNHLRVNDIVESLLVHPALAEALAEAAE